jgi:hypothetical protein
LSAAAGPVDANEIIHAINYKTQHCWASSNGCSGGCIIKAEP